ncbi:hypothetical protein [Arthrobacter sp. Soil762]|uniref:hypothetical protein n=1 Tax=Arthrobacter sp. Soil762 TaxID=1736401 RepID=UPI0006FE1F52|nr:hypothetical protein [Arthrobacter sp. Soil762]KRE72686.1 hypothetical protein ASG77_08455 [Arthrobacter sp. Soil762]
MSQDQSFADLLSSADPALMINDAELIRSRERSLGFLNSNVTHIAVGGSVHDFHRAPAKRHWGRFAVAGLAAAAVAASVLVASSLAPSPANVATAPTVEVTEVQPPPTGPARDLFIAADEVLVLQALPTPAGWNQSTPGSTAPGLGVEPVNVIQVLKGPRPTGTTTIDLSAMSAPTSWRNTNPVAPLTYLAFIKKGEDGVGHLMSGPLALLEILNLRAATLVDPVFGKPVDVGADLASRISVGPVGDVPLTTYPATQAASGPDIIPEQKKSTDGTSLGTMHGHVTSTEACFTFETSTEKVILRWPAGYTATTKLLPQSPEGEFRINGTSAATRAVVLNEWGIVYSYDGETRPLIFGTRSDERADCNGQTLPVFDIAPGGKGVSPFRASHGASGPDTNP